jgi:hypothetical protein
MVGVSRMTSCTVARKLGIKACKEFGIADRGGGQDVRKDAADDRIALLGTAHGLDDIAEEGRVQIAQEAHEAPVGPA